MEFLTTVYLFYMFISLYFFFLFIFLFLRHGGELFSYPRAKKKYSISAVIPVYNEEATIEGTLEAVLKIKYPLVEILVVNDGSTDNTAKIVENFAKRHKKIKLLNKKNSGKADSINYVTRLAKGELIALMDSDSFPDPDSVQKMVGYFDDPKTAVVTSSIVVKDAKRFIEKLQAIEYIVIAWTRKLLDFVGAVYVTPGPLSIYKKSILEEIGGFDKDNLTEDIEITWHLIHAGYVARMCLPARVQTIVPKKYRLWGRQRIRWNIGGLQTIVKYKSDFFKKGMLGSFVLPFFILSWFIGVIGLLIMGFLMARRGIRYLLLTFFASQSDIPLLALQDINLNPTILHFFGFSLFLFGLVFALIAMFVMKSKDNILKNINIFNFLVYLLLYLTAYALVIILSVYKYTRGHRHW